MKFSIAKSVEILKSTPAVLENLLSGLSDEWIRSNEGENTWSAYDVVGHLIHGEDTDWIPRAEIMLSNAEDKTFEPFDRFAQMNQNKDRSMEELLVEFRSKRFANLEKLHLMEIDETKLSQTGIHPELGESKLKELLATWTVHDLGHLAQISRVMAKQYKTEVGPWKKFLTILKM